MTASGSNGAGTYKQGLVEQDEAQGSPEKKAFPEGNGVERGGELSGGRVGERRLEGEDRQL